MKDVTLASRFRGFNLVNLFVGPGDLRWPEMDINGRGRFDRDDFSWIAEWGFNYVRLPLCYRWWASPKRPREVDPAGLRTVVEAVRWAQEVGLHVSVNLHHAPGYCINPPSEPEQASLWTSETMLDCFCMHWQAIARELRDAEDVDFNLINEPAGCTPEQYERVSSRAVDAIRQVTPDRLITIDGLDGGNTPCPTIKHRGLLQSCRGYLPGELTHYRAWWAGDSHVTPGWPQRNSRGEEFGERELAQAYASWRALSAERGGVICGEFGCHNQTPHEIVLAWMKSLLSILHDARVGWALWNLRGSFGILNPGRADVEYAEWHGLMLDRSMLELLQGFSRQ